MFEFLFLVSQGEYANGIEMKRRIFATKCTWHTADDNDIWAYAMTVHADSGVCNGKSTMFMLEHSADTAGYNELCRTLYDRGPIWWFVAGTSECAYMVNWYGHKCLSPYDNLAHVRVQAFIKQVSFRDRTPNLS